MKTSACRAPLAAAACACLLPSFGAAQSAKAPVGAWSKVPAPPTACFSEGDPQLAKIAAARAAIAADRDRQEEINQRIESEYQSIDPMEMANRMQQWMMSNPQAAMQFAQNAQGIGEDAQSLTPGITEATARFDGERRGMKARYDEALGKAQAGSTASWNELKKKVGIGGGDVTVKDPGVPAWAWEEEDRIRRQRDAEYAAFCPQWWGANGAAQAWLKTYRDWLASDWAAYNERLSSQNATTFAIMNQPEATWRSTAPEEAALKYLDAVEEVYSARRGKPNCDASGCSSL